jgi:hypothetical protein
LTIALSVETGLLWGDFFGLSILLRTHRTGEPWFTGGVGETSIINRFH